MRGAPDSKALYVGLFCYNIEMKEVEQLSFYSEQLITAIKGHPENTVWKNDLTAQAYWEQVSMAIEWCSGYAASLITSRGK